MSTPRVMTGRVDQRRLCPSCEVRVKLGNPRSSELWAARLSLTDEQVDLLLLAAREFDLLADEAGEYSDAVAFTDWLRPDVTKVKVAPVDAGYWQTRGKTA